MSSRLSGSKPPSEITQKCAKNTWVLSSEVLDWLDLFRKFVPQINFLQVKKPKSVKIVKMFRTLFSDAALMNYNFSGLCHKGISLESSAKKAFKDYAIFWDCMLGLYCKLNKSVVLECWWSFFFQRPGKTMESIQTGWGKVSSLLRKTCTNGNEAANIWTKLNRKKLKEVNQTVLYSMAKNAVLENDVYSKCWINLYLFLKKIVLYFLKPFKKIE